MQGVDWEMLQNTAYMLGVLSFLVGSVLFLPKYDKHKDPYECWLFLAGEALSWESSSHTLALLAWTVSPKIFRAPMFSLFGPVLEALLAALN